MGYLITLCFVLFLVVLVQLGFLGHSLSQVERAVRGIRSDMSKLSEPKLTKVEEGLSRISDQITNSQGTTLRVGSKVMSLTQVLDTHLHLAKLRLGQELDPESVFRIFMKSVDALACLKGRDNEEVARRAAQFKLSILRHRDNIALQELVFLADKETLMVQEGNSTVEKSE